MSKATKLGAQSPAFNPASPGFLYSLIVAALTIFAATGVNFPAEPGEIAGELTNLLSTGGFWALIGVAVSSVFFPLYNAWDKGQLNFSGIFSSTLTWVALAVLALDALALFGLNFPAGTAEQLVGMVFAKDWSALASMFFTVILPTIVRFIKDRAKA